MNNQVLIDNLRCIPDFPRKGINFRDVTTLYKNAECMKIMLDEMYELYKDKGITKIVGVESRGFVMASGTIYQGIRSRYRRDAHRFDRARRCSAHPR